MFEIAAAHDIPYAATAIAGYINSDDKIMSRKKLQLQLCCIFPLPLFIEQIDFVSNFNFLYLFKNCASAHI